MQTKYFRVNNNEYCHITEDALFIIDGKEVKRVPLAHELGEEWGIASIFNYIFFVLLFAYVAISVSSLEAAFFKNPIHYGALFLLFFSLVRIKNGFLTSKTPFLERKKIKSTYFKTPLFSYPRLVIYFEGPEGKILKRTIAALYKKEALPILQETGVVH